jgi:hypothetical protein
MRFLLKKEFLLRLTVLLFIFVFYINYSNLYKTDNRNKIVVTKSIVKTEKILDPLEEEIAQVEPEKSDSKIKLNETINNSTNNKTKKTIKYVQKLFDKIDSKFCQFSVNATIASKLTKNNSHSKYIDVLNCLIII